MNDDSTTQSERDQVASLLDNLLQIIAEGTRGGLHRVPTTEQLQASDWSARHSELCVFSTTTSPQTRFTLLS